MATVTHKPFRERIIHLLALKAYRKPELLLWMERERASPRDKAELGGILEEVHSNSVPVCSGCIAFSSLCKLINSSLHEVYPITRTFLLV